MLKVLFHPLTAGFKFTRIVISTTLLILYGCPSRQLSLTQGQDAHLTFPYPCDSTEVTLQHGFQAQFYQLTDGQSVSSPQAQVQRFRVQNRIINGNCSLDLTISDVMKSDEGTYISSVYKDRQILVDDTHRIYIDIVYPPGKASCVEGEERGGEWVAIECTAEVGSMISEKIECYQNGKMMPPLTDPVETYTTLTQIILLRKSQPAFCCSSTLNENKGRCECNDTALYLSGDSINDPCPTTSTRTTMPLIYNSTDNTQTEHFSTIMSINTLITMKEDNCKSVIVHYILVPVEVILLLVILCVFYKLKTKTRTNGQFHGNGTKTRTNHNDNAPLKNSTALKHTENGTRENGLIWKNIPLI